MINVKNNFNLQYNVKCQMWIYIAHSHEKPLIRWTQTVFLYKDIVLTTLLGDMTELCDVWHDKFSVSTERSKQVSK